MKKWTAAVLAVLFMLATVWQIAEASPSNVRYDWGFNKGKNEQPAEAGPKYDAIVDQYGAIYKVKTPKKEIYLTFDNGYENGYTEKVLDVLKKQKVPATFFVTGHYLNTAETLVKRMVKEGHIIGNHSWSHPDFTQTADAKLKEELDMVKKKTEELTGQKEMHYMRPPRGIFSERTLQLSNELGYKHILWSVAFLDWDVNRQQGWKYSYDNIMAQIHPGAILLLHSVSKDNAEALDKVITDLKKRGYTFKILDDMNCEKPEKTKQKKKTTETIL